MDNGNKPIVAAKKPAVVELQAGGYFWCACGRSRNQPYCDGSHAGTGINPLFFTLDENKKVALCLCKKTTTPPFCDGAHKKIAAE